MGAPSGGQGAGRYINASAPTFNFNAPQNTNANLPAIPVAQNNLNFAAPTGNVRQYAPLTVPQQLKTETTREVLPMNYVNLAGRGASPSARIETQRQVGGYDTLERQMGQRYVSRGRGHVQYLDINTPNVDPRRYKVQDYQTGWIGTKKTPNYELVNVGDRSLNVNKLKALQLKKGGKVTTKNKTKKVVKCTRGDGCAKRGKTKGRMV